MGKRGYGKTTLTKSLILSSKAKQVFILDFLREYSDLREEGKTFVFPYNFGDNEVYNFCLFAWLNSHENKKSLVIFDEIDLYGKKDKYISYLYCYGRHRGMSIIATAGGFYDLPVLTRKFTNRFSIFQVTDERDIQFLNRYKRYVAVEEVMALKRFEYINIDF